MNPKTKTPENKSTFKVVIPARFDSSRFPGKVLAPINGKPMIQHVYERACLSDANEVIIATDTNKVASIVSQFSANVAITDYSHKSGTDRIRQVAEDNGWDADQLVINVQGDSPLISPQSINQVGEIFNWSPEIDIATLAVPIEDTDEFYSKHVVKVVMDARGHALYFSRAPIPAQDGNRVSAHRHLGIYGYRVNTLRELTNCIPSGLELYERLEQLRALTLGMTIKVSIAREPHQQDVDTPADLKIVEKILKGL